MKARLSIGQIVHDRDRPVAKGTAIVVEIKSTGKLRICYWRGRHQHWSLPQTVDKARVQPMVDWTLLPLTEAKRLAAATFERIYLARAMTVSEGSVGDAARAAGVDRSNYRRLLQRHGLVKLPVRAKRSKKAKPRHKTTKAVRTTSNSTKRRSRR